MCELVCARFSTWATASSWSKNGAIITKICSRWGVCEMRRSAWRDENNSRNGSYNAGGQHLSWCSEVGVFCKVGTVGEINPLKCDFILCSMQGRFMWLNNQKIKPDFVCYTQTNALTMVKEFKRLYYYFYRLIFCQFFLVFFFVAVAYFLWKRTILFPSFTSRAWLCSFVHCGKQVNIEALPIDRMWQGWEETSLIEVWNESGIEHARDERWYYLHNEKMKPEGWGAGSVRIKLQNVCGVRLWGLSFVSFRGSKNVVIYLGHIHKGQEKQQRCIVYMLS